MADSKEQLEIAKRLQIKLLQRFETLLNEGELSATDAATLSRLLMQNGWSIDPAALPEGLRDKIKPGVLAFDEDVEESEAWVEA